MRAQEFIVERKFKNRKSSVLSTAYHYPSMPGDSAYQIYRLGLAMANPDIENAEGPAAAQAVTMAYTDEEEAIIQRASKRVGHKTYPLTTKGSTEPDSIDTVSPVLAFKGYPR
jgi:hypothetical protein